MATPVQARTTLVTVPETPCPQPPEPELPPLLPPTKRRKLWVDPKIIEEAVQYKRDHSWTSCNEVARIFGIESKAREIQRRFKNGDIGYRQFNKGRPTLLDELEIEAIRNYIKGQWHAGFAANRVMIKAAVTRLLVPLIFHPPLPPFLTYLYLFIYKT